MKKIMALVLAGFLAWSFPSLAAVPPLDSFQPVHAEGGKTWLFSPAGAKELKDAETGENIVEIWARVDIPARKLRDVLQWHYSPKRNAYRALDAYTYDFKGHMVDQ